MSQEGFIDPAPEFEASTDLRFSFLIMILIKNKKPSLEVAGT